MKKFVCSECKKDFEEDQKDLIEIFEIGGSGLCGDCSLRIWSEPQSNEKIMYGTEGE